MRQALNMKKIFIVLCLFVCASIFASPQPLPADQAFRFSATAKNYQMILVRWKIAPGYYLYQQKFHFRAIKPTGTQLGDPLYPSDTKNLKTALGNFSVYSNQLTIPIPVIDATQKNLLLQVHYQGCSQFGFCYPPTSKIVSIDLSSNYMKPTYGLNIDIASLPAEKSKTIFQQKNNFLLLLSFFGFGILLSLTPCVLPMIPILSSIIIGQKKITHLHAFLLSLFYVLGMAIMYAIAGVIFGMLGSNLQVLFQQTWIIVLFSLLIIAMALSLFGLCRIQLPEKLRAFVAQKSHRQKSGTYVGALITGVLSTLILSPCVTPPLIAALSFISQAGNASLGGLTLFALGLGMGVPLLLLGTFSPKLLPKSGDWMNTVKNITGILLLGIAVLMLDRVLPSAITLTLWLSLLFGSAIYFGAHKKKIIACLFLIAGIALAVFNAQQPSAHTLPFQPVDSIQAVDAALVKAGDRPVMLDFYADWCIACKELDALTFSDPAVQAALSHTVLLRADVTHNTTENRLLEQHFNVVAPPTLLFFKNQKEIQHSRLIGYTPKRRFLRHLAEIF